MTFAMIGKWFKRPKRSAQPASASVEALEARSMLAAGDFVSLNTFGFPEAFVTATAITTDAEGNQYLVGTFNGKIDLDFSSKRFFIDNDSNNQNGFVAKYSPTDKLLWAHQFGNSDVNDTANLVKVAANGDVVVGGEFEQTWDFGDGKVSGFDLESHGHEDGFIARYASNGRLKWAGNFGGTSDDFITALATTPGGDIIYSGTIRLSGDLDPGTGVRAVDQTRGVDDTFIAKISATNNAFKLFKIYGENDTHEGINGLAVDDNGVIYAAGIFDNTVQFDRGNSHFTLKSGGGDDIYLAKLTAGGAFTWIKTVGGKKDDTVVDLVLAPEGGFYIAGNFLKDVDFNPGKGQLILDSFSDNDAYVARYTADGAPVWARQFGDENTDLQTVKALAVDDAGNVYTTGEFAGEQNLDPAGAGQILFIDKTGDATVVQGQNTATDAYIVKLSSAGDVLFGKQIGGEDGSISPTGIASDGNGHVLLAGAFSGTVDFDPGPRAKTKSTTQDDENRGFVLKLRA